MISYAEFIDQAKSALLPGLIWNSPKGGVKEIIKLDSDGTLSYYQGRNKARIYLPLKVVWPIVQTYAGKTLSSRELRANKPRIFDSTKNGHSCNCVALFLVLKEVEMITHISGTGFRGSPYSVKLPV